MSSSKPLLSLKGARNVPPTAPTEPAPAGTKEPTQEKQMEASTENNQPAPPEPTALTAKQLAEIEERNSARLVEQKNREAKIAEAASEPPVSLIGMAAKGRGALLDGLRAHAQKAAPPPYVPPPMTERQKQNLADEMAAGAKAVAKAEAQKVRPGHPLLPTVEQAQGKEGVTNPVHRPGDFVPGIFSKDPALK